MTAPPLRTRLAQLVNKDLEWWLSEIRLRGTHAGQGAAVTNQFRVSHFAETLAYLFDLKRLESHGTHEEQFTINV